MLEKLFEKKPSVMALNSDNNTNAVSAGIDTATITKLPSGVVGREENINGETLFSVEEGKARVYFPRSTTEEVFYNPGKEMFPTLSETKDRCNKTLEYGNWNKKNIILMIFSTRI